MRLALAVLALALLAGCTSGGKDLPMVRASDPTWSLVPDHLDPAMIPTELPGLVRS